MAIAVNVRRREAGAEPLDLQADLIKVRWLARLLDSEFEFAGIKFGLDPLIGLIPVVGDTISLAAGLYPLHIARKHGMGRMVQLRMCANLAIDYVAGLTPVIGDAFDVAFKANLMNLAILEKEAARRQQ